MNKTFNESTLCVKLFRVQLGEVLHSAKRDTTACDAELCKDSWLMRQQSERSLKQID